MRELPLNGRNFEQLTLLARGVSTYPAGGSSALTSVANAYSIAGARPEGYANMLDGEDMLNWWQRKAGGDVTGRSLGIEAIAEFQTLTGAYVADTGNNRVLGFIDARRVGVDAPSLLTQKADLVIGQPDLQRVLPNYSPSNHFSSDAQTPNNTGFYAAGTGNDPVALAPGMLALLGRYGSNFSLAAASTQSPPWSTNGLNDVEVVVNGVPAAIFRLDQAVVYFQVPYAAPTSGTTDFVVLRPSTGQILAAANFAMQSATPGFYTSNQQGAGQRLRQRRMVVSIAAATPPKPATLSPCGYLAPDSSPTWRMARLPAPRFRRRYHRKCSSACRRLLISNTPAFRPNTPACGRSTYGRRQLFLPDLLPSSSR
jgi:hypothetical protein